MLVTVLAAVLLGQQAPGLDAPVTIEAKNLTVSAVMEEMGRQAGVKIHVQGAPLHDIVYVNFNNRSLRRSLDVMAKLCEAKWALSEDQVYFSAPWPPSDADAQAERAKVISDWLQKNPVPPAINKAIASRIIEESLLLKESSLPSNYQKSDKLFKQTPLPRGHLRVLHGIGAKALAEIPPGESRVYMATARGRIHALPSASASIFRDLISERTFYAELLASRGLTNEDYDGSTMWIPAIQSYSYNNGAESSWLLIVHNESYGYTSELRGMAEIQEGRISTITNDSMSFGQSYGMMGESETTDPFAKVEGPFVAPAEWKELINLGQASPMERSKPSEELTNRLIAMDKDEVLTDYVHEIFRQFGTQKKADVAALIPDAAFFAAVYNGSQQNKLNMAMRMAMMGQGKLEELDGAWLVSPQSVSQTRSSRIPRPQTAAYLQSTIQNGSADLDATADLAVAVDDEASLMIAIGINSLVIQSEDNGLMGNFDLLRLYGHLSASQRKTAKSQGLSLPFSSLNKVQQASLEKLMSGRNAGLASKETEMTIETSTNGGWEADELIQVKLPNGIPPQAIVTFRMEGKQKLFGQMKMGEYKYTNEVNLDTLAWSKAYAEAGYDDMWGYSDGFVMANRSYLQVVIDLGDMGYFAQTLPIGGPKKDAQFIPMSQLPQAMQDEFNKKLAEYRAQVKEMGPPPAGGGNGARRPPPPLGL